MNREDLIQKVLRTIPADSVGRYDLLPVFSDPDLFSGIVQYFSAAYAGKIDCVAAPEAIGWILGAAVARELDIGFVPIRKGGRLPYPEPMLVSARYLDYTGAEKTLALKQGDFFAGRRVLIADDWIETGACARCCASLVERLGGAVAGLAVIGIDSRPETIDWIDSGFAVFIGRDI